MQSVITVEVAGPNGVFTGEFPKTAKVSEVIAAAVAELGLECGDEFELVYKGEVLEPKTRPLVSFGIEGEVRLELVAVGSGVSEDGHG